MTQTVDQIPDAIDKLMEKIDRLQSEKEQLQKRIVTLEAEIIRLNESDRKRRIRIMDLEDENRHLNIIVNGH
jgi:predicted nuclease with TOPRIM domain